MNKSFATLVCNLCFCLMLLPTLTVGETRSTTYYIPDAQGSPMVAMDEDGNVIWRKHYQPFGKEIEQGDESQGNRINYTGHVLDRNTDLIYMGARYYDPSIGRFLSIDPAPVKPAIPQTFGRYTYTYNNPYRYVDPDGRVPALHEALMQGRQPPGFGIPDAGFGAPGLRNFDSLTTRQFGQYPKNPNLTLSESKGVGSRVQNNTQAINPTTKQIEKFQKQLKEHGPKSLERSLRKIEKRLNEHTAKLGDIKREGGHASSVEREIRNFEREIEAIKQTLKGES